MKPFTKDEREIIRMKFGGKCAYCGCDLPDKWHADHLEAVVRAPFGDDKGKPQNPHLHTLENAMPACPQCNISKRSFSLEFWREWLSGHVDSLNSHYSIYRLCKAFGLIEETDAPVVFYFEIYRARNMPQQPLFAEKR